MLRGKPAFCQRFGTDLIQIPRKTNTFHCHVRTMSSKVERKKDTLEDKENQNEKFFSKDKQSHDIPTISTIQESESTKPIASPKELNSSEPHDFPSPNHCKSEHQIEKQNLNPDKSGTKDPEAHKQSSSFPLLIKSILKTSPARILPTKLESIVEAPSQISMGAMKLFGDLTGSSASKSKTNTTQEGANPQHDSNTKGPLVHVHHENSQDLGLNERKVIDNSEQDPEAAGILFDNSSSPMIPNSSAIQNVQSDTKTTPLKRNKSKLKGVNGDEITNSNTLSTILPSRNRVLPSYEEELEPDNSVLPESISRSWMSRLLHRINSSYHYLMGNESPQYPHSVSRTVDLLTFSPHNIRKIAIIGIHGWFPSKLIQRVVGEPVGTSQYFAHKMSEATQIFFEKRYGILLQPEADITIIPLEGEGLVENRVEKLYKQLLKSPSWAQAVSTADLVLFSAHSQGSPVSIMIVSKMIKENLIDPLRQKVGVLCMAGIHHGPFPHLKSSLIVRYVEADPARQLFDFNDPTSPIVKLYTQSLEFVLNAGVRLVTIGSWYDQVVPLYSGTLHGISHPGIYRAMYIDANDYQPNFLSHLVVFALSLRNHGLDDHGLIVHISEALAGSIYGIGTQGHYVIYEELNTYLVAIAWIMGRERSMWGSLNMNTSPKLQEGSRSKDFYANSWFSSMFKTKRFEDQPKNTDASHSIDKKSSSTNPSLPSSTRQKDSMSFSERSPSNQFHSKGFFAPSRLNPYHLPWIMSKIAHDPVIKSHPKLSKELDEVIRLFASWDPGSNRMARDIRYRLDPLKSKL